jgi:hypothetical protein
VDITPSKGIGRWYDLGHLTMKIGLVGFPGSGRSTVFGALTGLPVETGYGARRDKANLGVVKVPDPRVDAVARIVKPKKTVYAEIAFTDLAGGEEKGIDRRALNAMRSLDALCQVVRAFPDPSGQPPEPAREIADLEMETILADLEVVEPRVARLQKDRSNPRELELLQRVQAALEEERTLRALRRHVPVAVPGIVFLSGGQRDDDADANLDALNRAASPPWQLSFSYGRALQAAALKTWCGDRANARAAQDAFAERVAAVGAARRGALATRSGLVRAG